MTVQRVVWMIVGVLLLAVVFMGGLAVGTLSARRMTAASLNTRAAMLRGNAPNQFQAQPNGRQGVAPNTPNNRIAPNNRQNGNQGRQQIAPRVAPNVPNNRMTPNNRWNGNQGRQQIAPRVAPNQPRLNPPTPRQNVPPTLPRTNPNPKNRLPRRAQ